jgi:resuscitation-promoting factor RpfB
MPVSEPPTDTLPPLAGSWSAGRSPGTSATSPTGRTTSKRPRRAWLLTIVALVLLGGAVAVLLETLSSVEVQVDGEVLTSRTFAPDVATALDRLGVEVGDADQVVPAPDTPVEDGLRVVVTRAKVVDIDLDGHPTLTVVAVADTVADVLREAGLDHLLVREARIDPAPDAPIADGGRIVIGLPVTVAIAVDGAVRQVETYADTVGGALADAGVGLGDHDLVDPPLDRTLDRPTDITVQRVDVVEEVVEVPIEHGEQRRDTDELREGETRVETPGQDGLRRETYEVTRVDGEVTERELVAEEVVREPIDQVALVGVAPGPVREAQRLLTDLGYPAGPVDGIDGAQTRRALCSWRRLEGHPVNRQPLQPGELEALRATTGLPAAPAGRGVTVDKACQAVYYRQDGGWQDVHEASTGAGGLPREGSYQIRRTHEGWHTSTLYPSPAPNMYNSLFFHGAVAIHGSHDVPPHPASAGCVRVTPQAADRLFADLRIGDPVRVIDAY